MASAVPVFPTRRREVPMRAPRTTAGGPAQRVVAGLTVVALVAGCSVARRADEPREAPPTPVVVMPTAVAPPQAEGLDGTAGTPGPQVCSAITTILSRQLGLKVTAKPNSWNDGGLP